MTYAEAKVETAVRGPAVAAIGTAKVPSVATPTTAAYQAVGTTIGSRRIFGRGIIIIVAIIPIMAPLPDISRHIQQPITGSALRI